MKSFEEVETSALEVAADQGVVILAALLSHYCKPQRLVSTPCCGRLAYEAYTANR